MRERERESHRACHFHRERERERERERRRWLERETLDEQVRECVQERERKEPGARQD